MIFFKKNNDDQNINSEWITISDLMAGLMAIFLLIASFYMFENLLQKQELDKTKKEIEISKQELDKIREALIENKKILKKAEETIEKNKDVLRKIDSAKQTVSNIKKELSETQEKIYIALMKEFKNDLDKSI